ncbi:MAG TPA: hypothetical protein VGV37_06820 [Aliidongia sp.]|uniref:hypothetical protein n=1 Tax=Aliidongia sp. TaxID=1914230 RepID=UPI002DDCAB73|nr:hypothetical protein [Aliidongia sp.]HEV2674239.1 hypothetical protein [Aliidongia sp.]
MLDAVKPLLNGGTCNWYSGTQPTNPDTALSGNTLLATWTFSATAYGSDSLVSGNEQATGSFVSASVSPVANGTATFARCLKSDGTTVVCDLTIGTSGTDIVIGTTTVNTTIPITLTDVMKLAVD